MTEQEALISLNFADIGSRRLKRLLECFDRPSKILQARLDKLKKINGIGEEIANSIVSLKNIDLKQEFNLAKKLGLKILTVNDPSYPQRLKEIYDPPIVLYVKGDFSDRDKFSLAVVGSRRASYYGLVSAEKFARELSDLGLTIISGMARGIDTAAHKGALKNKNRTLAVMGSGFGNIYPPENEGLLEQISQNGAVISEFPIETLPFRQNFPRRNRVISGLSLGVLVVEAARNSGALITADFALEEGREVFALPGKVNSNTSFGTNELIKQGAKLVSGVEDILGELNIKPVVSPSETGHKNVLNVNLGENEEPVFNVISSEPVSFDDIVDKTKKDPSSALSILFKLEMKKLIRQLAGKQFVRTNV